MDWERKLRLFGWPVGLPEFGTINRWPQSFIYALTRLLVERRVQILSDTASAPLCHNTEALPRFHISRREKGKTGKILARKSPAVWLLFYQLIPLEMRSDYTLPADM